MVDSVSDFKMPEKIVTKLLKDALPEDVAISKEAKNAACRFAGIFLIQLSMESAERASNSGRSSLDSSDVLAAMNALGQPEFVPQLSRFVAQRKRDAKRRESNLKKPKNTPHGPQVSSASPTPSQQIDSFQEQMYDDDQQTPIDN